MTESIPKYETSLEKTIVQSRETGMAMVLLCLLMGYFLNIMVLFPAAIVLQIVTMTVPVLFKPLSVLWFGLSHKLGVVVTNVIFTILFFVIVTPVGILRRALGADSLALRKWQKGPHTMFKIRDHKFTASDLIKPY